MSSTSSSRACGSSTVTAPGHARVKTVYAGLGAVELAPTHYMQKEIFEQPRAIGDTLETVTSIEPRSSAKRSRCAAASEFGADTGLRHQLLRQQRGAYWIESIAQVPGHGRIASEYRYRVSCLIRRAGGRRLAIR